LRKKIHDKFFKNQKTTSVRLNVQEMQNPGLSATITVEQIASLAKLQLSEKEAVALTEQLGHVLNHFEQVAKINTDGIEPLVTPTDMPNFLRDDVVVQETSVEEIMSNAPQRTGHLFTVPPVV
jgi:aspartyl-tRNA(Asn)/glutamyl-tRNA(Gln) amidotransferase subunit C